MDIEELRKLLRLYKIDDTQFTDEDLELLISQAKTLIGKEFIEDANREDYVEHLSSKRYMTDYYPILVDSVQVFVDDEEVIPRRITENGILYFEKNVNGEFLCTYTQGFERSSIDEAIKSIVMYMIQEQDNQNISSISEGDVSVSYNTDDLMSSSTKLNELIESIRNKFRARVRLL